MGIRINLLNADDVEEFLATVSSFEEDIDLIQGSQVLDAKSLIVLMNVDFNKPTKVSMVSNNHERQVLFAEAMQPFKARG